MNSHTIHITCIYLKYVHGNAAPMCQCVENLLMPENVYQHIENWWHLLWFGTFANVINCIYCSLLLYYNWSKVALPFGFGVQYECLWHSQYLWKFYVKSNASTWIYVKWYKIEWNAIKSQQLKVLCGIFFKFANQHDIRKLNTKQSDGTFLEKYFPTTAHIPRTHSLSITTFLFAKFLASSEHRGKSIKIYLYINLDGILHNSY